MENKKATYNVNVHYDVVLTTSVEASSEEEAEKLAMEILENESLNKGEVVNVDACVTDCSEW